MSGRNWSDALNLFVNIIVVLLLSFFLLRPGGLVGDRVGSWLEDRRVGAELERVWDDLTGVGGRIGPDGAPVTLVEFSDYQCPFCREAYRVLPGILDTLEVQVIHLHFPLTRLHPASEAAALASICAEAQGRFRQIHDLLLRSDSWLEDRDWLRLGEAAGVPELSRFEACLAGEEALARLDRDREFASRLGVGGTPTYLSQDGRHVGVPTLDALSRIVR